MNREEILEHAKKVEEQMNQRLEQKKKEREQRIKENYQSYDYGKYKTKFLDLVLEQEQTMKDKEEVREEERAKI